MSILLKTPFRSNKIETDPYVYGLRPSIISCSVKEVFNDKSILVTGTRGIGKTSLNYQLQKILNGDTIILNRCCLDIQLENYITVSHVCTPYDTLETIVLGIVNELEKKINEFNDRFVLKDAKVEFNFLGVVKSQLSISTTQKTEYNSLIDIFFNAISKFADIYVAPHINISIDELDQLSEKENVAHFIKVILEKLEYTDRSFLSFTLIGQDVLFDRLFEQQPAFHRLVKHIRLQPLNKENTEYVFDACLKRSNVPILVVNEAKDMLIGLSGGYPAVIQLLGHESFNVALEKYDKIPKSISINLDDVINGVKNAIINDGVRFETIFKNLTGEEQSCILTMANISQKKIPFEYKFEHIVEGLLMDNPDERKKNAEEIIKSLIEKQVLIVKENDIVADFTKMTYGFREELFRVYLTDKLNNSTTLDYD